LNNLISNIWSYTTRTLSAFGFNVTVGTNSDKTGYSLSSSQSFTNAQKNPATLNASDVTGNVAANVIQVNGTAQTAKDLGASATQTGDAYARLGSPANGTIAADIAQVETHANNADIYSTLAAGLAGVNSGIRNISYSGSVILSADIYLYDNATHAALNDGVTGVVHHISVGGTASGSNPSSQTSALIS
jgi:hypothetical protein